MSFLIPALAWYDMNDTIHAKLDVVGRGCTHAGRCSSASITATEFLLCSHTLTTRGRRRARARWCGCGTWRRVRNYYFSALGGLRLTKENYTISLIQASRKGFLGWVTAGECAAILCAHASGLAAVDVSQDGRAVVR
jgi:hypothetical protein